MSATSAARFAAPVRAPALVRAPTRASSFDAPADSYDFDEPLRVLMLKLTKDLFGKNVIVDLEEFDEAYEHIKCFIKRFYQKSYKILISERPDIRKDLEETVRIMMANMINNHVRDAIYKETIIQVLINHGYRENNEDFAYNIFKKLTCSFVMIEADDIALESVRLFAEKEITDAVESEFHDNQEKVYDAPRLEHTADAERLRNEAKSIRNEAVKLMDKAKSLRNEARNRVSVALENKKSTCATAEFLISEDENNRAYAMFIMNEDNEKYAHAIDEYNNACREADVLNHEAFVRNCEADALYTEPIRNVNDDDEY